MTLAPSQATPPSPDCTRLLSIAIDCTRTDLPHTFPAIYQTICSCKGLYIELYYNILPAPLDDVNVREGDEDSSKYSYVYYVGDVYKQKNDTAAVPYKYTVKQDFTYPDAKKSKKQWDGWADVYKTYTLKKGTETDRKQTGKRPAKDYVEHLYLLKTENGVTYWKSVEKANEKGTYLVALEGIGNYCSRIHDASNTYDGNWAATIGKSDNVDGFKDRRDRHGMD